MKILHVTKKYPGALGGDTVVVWNLQKHQEAAGHSVAILTSNCKEIQEGPHIYKCGLRDTPSALDHITFRRLVSLVMLFFKAFFVLARERPDVIHAHSVDMTFFVSFAARFFGIPIVHTFHIVTFYDENQSTLRRKSELLLAKAAGIKLVTAPNTYDVAALKNAGLQQATLLPNGVDLEFWQPEDDVQKSDTFTFLSVGRLEPQKGHEYLVRATALLRDASPQAFRVVIAGEGSEKWTLQELAQSLGMQDAVEFVGRKTPAEVRSLLSAADAVVFASLYETTPITLLEAWAVGVPAIMTPVGILHGAMPDTAHVYLAEPKDEQSLVAAMQYCMTDETSRNQVAMSGHREVKKYAWPGIAKTAESLYGSVL